MAPAMIKSEVAAAGSKILGLYECLWADGGLGGGRRDHVGAGVGLGQCPRKERRGRDTCRPRRAAAGNVRVSLGAAQRFRRSRAGRSDGSRRVGSVVHANACSGDMPVGTHRLDHWRL
jgi:hypothetical protein